MGIRGSNMHAFLGIVERRPVPLILVHEATGVVVHGPMEDKRVTFNPLATCGKCKVCLRGQDNSLYKSADHLDATATRRGCRTCNHN